ncbi:Por secretion system C-terminal sorting domain-containing protein [Flexibacter flexilis DSM 6793]|uniref:Por secretion system C-terminal sorting domain-containing protein n=1 Tax=Flexibacter flexilis DSM 6793 TaxID=927664 RepID=A0A1I1H4Y9_9BACT|nr:BspA family leucine-rich repeat surface protein [Flexibacter flexilis]SFC19077.1 Por secretion system C-terminal sorting domain-containing protein [Flexibacter flexilis DSM 6793]
MKNTYKLIVFVVMLCLWQTAATAQNFITKWNLATAGSGTTQLSIGTVTSGTVNYTWQELSPGTASGSGSWSGATLTITGLPTGATIQLEIAPTNFQRINISYGTDRNRLLEVAQWGGVAWTSMQTAFYGCANMQVTAIDVPNLGGVMNMSYMFANCTNLNSPSNIGTWNTSNITNMSYMFQNATVFNQNISNWNTSNVTNMSYMFYNATAFNQNISNWNTSNVTNMSYMFYNATAFNQNIGNWNTSNVTNMSYMFYNATAFNQNIGAWNTTNVTNMSSMFVNATAFNQNIGAWNTTNVTNMNSMFQNATAFNQDIGNWNTSNTINTYGMFYNATAFNQNIGNWNTNNVTIMSYMFRNATSFNQNIGNWNTSNVTIMNSMFQNATAFNQNIGNWNTSNVTNMNSMFYNATAFNQDIGTWNTSNVTEIGGMFYNATAFNQNIGNWNTTNVKNMGGMFSNADAFNQNIGAWNTANVTNMSSMFLYAMAFNQNIGNWNTSNVSNMSYMFQNAKAFNQNIGAWNTANVTDMSYMFQNANIFNQDIGNWNISKVTNMSGMFWNATSFNQNIGAWTFNTAVNMNNMLDNCGMNCSNYSATLIGWNSNPLPPTTRILGAMNRRYSTNAAAARANLVLATASGGKGWTIIGDAAYTTTPALVASSQAITATQSCESAIYTNPSVSTQKLIGLNANGNASFAPTSVVLNNQGNLTGGSGTFSAAGSGYYQSTDASNTLRVSKRLHTVVATGSHTTNGGVIVRVYYNPTENNNMTATAWPISSPSVTSGWFKHSGSSAQDVLNDMAPTGLSNVEFITPTATGTESGVSYVEFTVTSFSTFGYYSQATTILPIKLISFKADCQQDNVTLRWATASETNNESFAIERSTDAKNWEVVGTLKGYGNSNERQQYAFVDKNPLSETAYYRLKQTDFDGKYSYSPTAMSNCGGKGADVFEVYPNPSTNGIFHVNSTATNGRILVTDALGKMILETSTTNEANTKLDLSGYGSGIYLVRLISDGGTQTQKVSISQ